MVSNKDGNEELIIEYLNEYEQLTILRDQFNENLKNGYFLISKSKYSMGQKSLGELQYPENMKPLFNVKIEDCKYSYDTKDDTFLSIQYNDNNKQAKSNNDSSIGNNKNSKEQSSSTTTTTRRRNVNSKEPIIKTSSNGVTTMGSLESLLNNCSTNDNSSDDDDDDESDTDEEDEDNDNSFENNPNLTEEEKQKIFQEKVKKQQQKKKLKANKKIIRKDPIYWFGISTPTSLKQSQSYFKQAINQSIEISNKLIKMEIIYKKYWEQNS
ncbi:hypothetical protein DDB_G0274723 [Dictyostelium discoideum AX4]|uniref:Vacuolar ATPase assembly protein VMA22 n=1 Tax=Dictyostelium discoideum TaxID=44689 RepID=Q555R1_DICDI|nr:hypothetical protein DDB_G0274723 [Dictyostelium discoideum AX4]EAL70254.1 hypothetical protein DDB_G0274723 [Dictyostelium discoideum AX4]|eukprot:XP_644002.1 hypothetical protein DDB_G0274723 [Dictyostelium discoideum AX4]